MNYTGVIIMYCGGNQSLIESTGKEILKAMQYRAEASKYKPYIYYKTDNQTLCGTSATGCMRNWTYRIPCNSKIYLGDLRDHGL
jgi:hypothetical protein